jgi:ABC-type branched-subunit amino acid transport system permease subunit
VAFNEITRYLPQIGRPGLIDALQWIVIGLLALVFLWFWPRGVIPERRRRFAPGQAERESAPDALPDATYAAGGG